MTEKDLNIKAEPILSDLPVGSEQRFVITLHHPVEQTIIGSKIIGGGVRMKGNLTEAFVQFIGVAEMSYLEFEETGRDELLTREVFGADPLTPITLINDTLIG